MTVTLALVGLIPLVLFGVAGTLIVRDNYVRMSKGAFALTAAGLIMVLWAQLCMSVWRLFYAAGLADLYLFNDQFLPTHAAGFLILGIGLVVTELFPQDRMRRMFSSVLPTVLVLTAGFTAPPENRATVLFVVLTILGALGLCGMMALRAFRLQKQLGMILFGVAFLFFAAMAVLSIWDFSDNAVMSWIDAVVNIAAPLCLLAGIIVTRRTGRGRDVSPGGPVVPPVGPGGPVGSGGPGGPGGPVV